jgi:cellulose synthase/poly-beta-1,6-N-acetylglucosamine synthase-like glycosyltransferase
VFLIFLTISLLSLSLLLLTVIFRVLLFGRRAPLLSSQKPNGLSLIIPFRDEEPNLYNLLEGLSAQKLEINFEVILVNDGSSDSFEAVLKKAERVFKTLDLRVVNSHFSEEVKLSSKQQALEVGVAEANFNWLVFTDADMQFSHNWLQTFLDTILKSDSKFVFGRTGIINHGSLFSLMQKVQLDFLFGVAWLFSKARVDSSCMGNNIAIEKQLYQNIGGQHGVGYSLVEDKKLLSLVVKNGVIPEPTRDFTALAKTSAVSSYKTYLHQLLRWLKGGAGESLFLGVVAVLWGVQLFSVVLTIFTGLNYEVWQIVSILNFMFLVLILIFLFKKIGELKSLLLLPLYFLFATLEVVVLIPALIFIKPVWKGRQL